MKPNLNINLNKFSEIKNKIFYSFLCMIIYRFGSYIVLPGVNSAVMNKIMETNSSGILGVFNMLSGGSLGRMSVFALAIMPYITASIIMQLLGFISKEFSDLKKDGITGKRKISFYTKILTVLLASFQAYGIVISLNKLSLNYENIIIIPVGLFKIINIVTLTTATMFLMWLSDQISKRGIGNGTSLIIFSGIISGMPKAALATLELARTQQHSVIFVLILLLAIILMVAFIIFFEKAYRKVIINYPQRQQGNKILGSESSHMPLKLNVPGVIPPIFANSLLLFPLTVVNFTKNSQQNSVNKITEFVHNNLAHGKNLYLLLYVSLIIFFSFFYSAIIFNSTETAENLRKYGAFISGIKPGVQTAKFLDNILTKLTFIGAAYLSLICAIPELLISKYSIPFYLGGTGVLIVVNVIMDTTSQIQSQLLSYQYDKLIRKTYFKKNK